MYTFLIVHLEKFELKNCQISMQKLIFSRTIFKNKKICLIFFVLQVATCQRHRYDANRIHR